MSGLTDTTKKQIRLNLPRKYKYSKVSGLEGRNQICGTNATLKVRFPKS